MKYIRDLREGDRVSQVFLCKTKKEARTRDGKLYFSLALQDKTGTLDAKIWDINSDAIDDFNSLDLIYVSGNITVFNGMLQLRVVRARTADPSEYSIADFIPTSSRDIEEMYAELLGYVESIENEKLRTLARRFFVEDKEFIRAFKEHSAAKSVHHGFMGGLLEHTLSVTGLCDFFCTHYSFLNRDLLILAALFHDIGKTKELSGFPENDYTDEGQLLGHIVIGTIMVDEKIKTIDGFPKKTASELKHCILAHHGEYEYGSPKKPALAEACALNFADNLDAKMETFKELFGTNEGNTDWLGFNRLFDSNIRMTSEL